MFNVDQAIQEWRRRLVASGIQDPLVLEELEGHLRNEIQELVDSGKPAPEALEIAVSHLGAPALLAIEFRKLGFVPLKAWWPVRAASVFTALAAVCLCALFLYRVSQGKTGLLLAAHVVSVTLGYGIMFVIGGLAIGYVCTRLFYELPPAHRHSVRRSSHRLAALAAGLTALGVLSGMLWAKENWGRYWGWDPKEIGGLLVLLWAVLITALKWFPGISERALARLAIIGNLVTAWAWFGTATRGLHAYGFPSRAVFSVFVVLHGAFLLAGFLPANCPKFRPSTCPKSDGPSAAI